MADEQTEDDIIELSYEPFAGELGDGCAVIGDLVDFLSETKSSAVMLRDGQMWVLRSDTLTWMKIEDVRKAEKKTTIRGLPKAS